MKFVFARVFVTAALLFSSGWVDAQYSPPVLTAPVMDLAGLLPADMEASLNRGIRALRDQGGSQLQVLTLPDLSGMTIEQVSIETTDKWQLGGKENDNGILLLVALKERKIRIEVGQGLEGALPDSSAWRIIEEVMVPLFRSGRPDSAVMLGLLQITKKTDPQFDFEALLLGEGYDTRSAYGRSSSKAERIFTILLILFFLYLFFRRPAAFVGLASGSRYGGWGGGGGGFSGGGASGGW